MPDRHLTPDDPPAGAIDAIDAEIRAAYPGHRLLPLCRRCGAPLVARTSRVRGLGPRCARREEGSR